MAPAERPADKIWLAQLIMALASEIASLSAEITDMGNALSGRVLALGEMQGVKEMQSFDVLSQLAWAQAQLLETISRQLDAPAADMKEALAAGIAGMPILDVRRRMLGAIHGTDAGAAQADQPAGSADDETWF